MRRPLLGDSAKEGVDGPDDPGHDGFGLGEVTAPAAVSTWLDSGGFIRATAG